MLMKPVWIIDDDRSIRWVLEKALTRESIAFKSFSSADEALGELNSEAPQVIVSDIRMPGESGLILLQRAKELYPGQPLFLMGISMGGCASIHATLALQDAGIDLAALLTGGLILLCPLVHTVKQPPNSLKVAAQLLARLSPRLPLPTAHTPGNGVDIAHKELMRQAMAADGHIYTGGIRVGTALALLAAAEQAQQRLDELLLGHRVSLLTLHGEADDIVDINGSRELHSRSGATDKTFISYPDARHALLNEAPHVHTVMQDLLRWMLHRELLYREDTRS